MKKTILTVLVVILLSPFAFAAPKVGFDLTSAGIGARPIALGGAYTGLANDASAIFSNPAGLASQKNINFVSMSTKLLNSVEYQMAGFSYPTEYGTFGVGYMSATTPAGYYTYYDSGVTVEGGMLNFQSQMLFASWGYNVGSYISKDTNLSLGLNLKTISEGVTGSMSKAPSASGFDADLGLLYVPFETLSVGATLQNFYKGTEGESLTWSTGEKEQLPRNLNLGVAYKALDSVTLVFDNTVSMSETNSSVSHAGVEWQAIEYLALRLGMDQKEIAINDDQMGVATNLSLGVGIMYSGFRFDYAYKMDAQVEALSTHYFSFCYTGIEQPKPIKTDRNEVASDTKAPESKVVVSEDTSTKKYKNETIKTQYNLPMDSAKKGNDKDTDILSQYEKLIERANNSEIAGAVENQ
jgi:hypothetical protein